MNRIIRSAISLTLSAVLLMPTGGILAAEALEFTDVKEGHWAAQSIEDVVNRGLFSGTGENTFSPDGSMTRAMFATVLSRLAKAEVDNAAKSAFSDVTQGSWYAGAVAWCAENGIVKGTGGDTFTPDAEVTREQMAAMTVRYCEFADIKLPTAETPTAFTDAALIPEYAQEAVRLCADAGIITGYADGSFGPGKVVSRAEVATITARVAVIVENAEKKADTYTVTFHTDGGSDVDAQTVTKGDKAVKPARPTKKGYSFVGWYSDSALKKAYSFDAEVIGDITVYAKWTKQSSGGGSSYVDPLAMKLAERHPDLTSVSANGKKIVAVSGASVQDVKDQLVPVDSTLEYTTKVTDWLGEEKISGNNRDLLTAGDKLVVSANDRTMEYTIEVPNKESDDHYWNAETYNAILKQVGDNLPQFGSAVYDITDERYDAYMETVTIADAEVPDYTKVFRAAIAECTENGGGTVLVPASEAVYYTGSIQLDDNVNLHVEEGAIIDFVPTVTLAHYPRAMVSYEGIDYYGYSTPIYAYQKENVGVSGGGIIRFSDTSGWSGNKDILQQWNFGKTPVEKRDAVALGQKDPAVLVQLYDCKNILISDITLGNSPFWTMNMVLCENVLVRGVSTTSISSNSDGCDPESCKYVIIENCHFANKDDNIALKSGRINNGLLRAQPTEYVIIRNNEFYRGSGVSIGSEAAGGANDVFVENNFWNGQYETMGEAPGDDKAWLGDVFRIKYQNSMNCTFENVYYRNCALGGFRGNLFFIEYVSDENLFNATGERWGAELNTPVMRNIAMSNMFTVNNRVDGTMDSQFGEFLLVAECQDLQPINGLYLKDINLKSTNQNPPEKEMFRVNSAVNVNLTNVSVNGVDLSKDDSFIEIKDVKINDVLLDKADTTSVTSVGSDGTLVVTGVIDTDIPDFETIGSVRVTYDLDRNYMDATLSKVNDEVCFTATLTGVGANLHDLAVVAKSNQLPFPSPNDKAERASAYAPHIAVNAYPIDVEGILRDMNVLFSFAPDLTEYHNVPILNVGGSVEITGTATDAKTGVALEDAVLSITKSNAIFETAVADNVITVTGKSVGRNHITVTFTCDGYVDVTHTFRKIPVYAAPVA